MTLEDANVHERSENRQCPFNPDNIRRRSKPIQAKKYVQANAKPKLLAKPGKNDVDKFSYNEIVDCPIYETWLDRTGKFLGPFNVVQFYRSVQTVMDPIKIIRGIQAEFPAVPCIRANLGCDLVILTGNTPVHWCLTQDLDSVDKDQKHRLGPFQSVKRFIGESTPLLLATEKDGHSKLRQHFLAILEKRRPDLNDVVEKTFSYRLGQMIECWSTDPKYFGLEEVASSLAGYFCTEWILGSEPPSNLHMMKFVMDWNSQPGTDSFIGDILGQMFTDVTGFFTGAFQRRDDMIKLTRTSRYFKQYVNIAKEMGIDLQDFDRALTHTIGLPANKGLSLPFASLIAVLGENLGTLSDLRMELGMDHLNIENVDNVDKYPLLDALIWECYRFFIRGYGLFRRATKDLLVPGGNGKAYRAKKGDLLMMFLPLAMRDQGIFDDPDRFNPCRFLDNPELKKHTFPFGLPSDFDPKQAIWSCPIHTMGLGSGLLKLFIGKWIQRVEWYTVSPPQFHGDASGEFRPYNMPLAKLQYRQEYLDSLK